MLLAADAAVAKSETMSFIDQEHKLLIDGQNSGSPLHILSTSMWN